MAPGIKMRTMIVAGLVWLLVPVFAAAQGPTTGSIRGTVTDNTGAIVPGVTATVSSPSLLGTQTSVSNERGAFRFPSLVPGLYKVVFELQGFATLVREGIRVSIGFTADVNVQLTVASLQETVTVSGQSPVVDTQNTNVQTTFTSEQLSNIPNARDMWALISEAPGMTVGRFDVGGSTFGSQTGYNAYGSSGQVRIQLEGNNATEGSGSAGWYFDFGAMEEWQFGTSGNDAQMPTPGVAVNAVMKSGGNQLRGNGYLDYENQSVQGSNIDDRLANLGIGEGARIKYYVDPNVNIGGPIRRDRVWYFGSARVQESSTTVPGWPSQAPSTGPGNRIRIRFGTFKLSWQINEKTKLIHFQQWSAKTQPYRNADVNNSLTSVYKQASYAWIAPFELNRIFSPTFYADSRLTIAGYNWPNYYYGADGKENGAMASRVFDQNSGNIDGSYYETHTDRRRYGSDIVAHYFNDGWLGGNHHFKFGVSTEWETGMLANEGYKDSLRLVFRSTGRDFTTPFRVELYNHATKYQDSMWHHGAFVQDQISIGKRLTVNAGVRWDYYNSYQPEQEVLQAPFSGFFYAGVPLMTSAGPFSLAAAPFGTAGVVPANNNIIVYKHAIAPRLGVSWNIDGAGKNVLKANWGRFYNNPSTSQSADTNPLQTTYATFGWTDRNADSRFTLDELGPFVSLSGGARNSAQKNLPHPYTDETSIWFERSIAADLGARAGFVYKKLYQQWQLMDVGRPYSLWTIPFTAVDPGRDGVVGTSDDATFTAYNLSQVAVSRLEYQAPDASQRSYKSVEFSLNKRMSNRWSAMATYMFVWNNERYFNIPQSPNEAFNNDVHTTLSTFKLLASYQAPYGLVVSPVLRYQAGAPLPRRVNVSTNGGTVAMLVEPSGTYRQDNVAIFDVRVEKQFAVGRGRRLGVFLDLFNIANSNAAQTQDSITGTRNATQPDGTVKQVPRFLYPTAIIGPRIARFGLKFSF